MRFSELSGKEIVDLNNGERIGTIGPTDMVIDPNTGKIEGLVIPKGKRFGKAKEEFYIPWTSIRKIGPAIIIVENHNSLKTT
ncbi:YlmC/YmxH family sporulation protein [Tepidibacillus fermentans]|uniref:YlmC/YmxH family sporulation protein n=1 Tax=Tepidibacillus fermentans TaxID=1281767 RepID=A0A4R3KIB8_9BACI|nr:YlmC/YmxH family sporulation protein [Tepidibacillus fermentans]TCS82996.1 YlmC/YmxH family sporulation protein [Tepidibacillus fermentans]